ncbi:FAD-dependent monooxygenase [Streptomyces verrucosisporus]|uniref:FAD-dependent monooxygenase n=1 Tax=Streptomyces verrucosisporus TaxID=1695161 RepID=UPI0019CF7880|nr:FAD-dependent monooxygenase [Streptomyces verrucosisporus]MBN3932262.1 FAD-dependent monooxygenase [Streptomyces verrucosisporus]
MSPARTVLVAGGGICGNALAVLLRRAGIGVDLVELSSDWSVQGSGITLQGNALRVLREVGAWEEIRASITEDRAVNYTWFHRLLVEGPWHRGRVVLAGDAAHACPPTLAQGAAMSLEDALVLAELLTGGADWDERTLAAYRERRMPRVRMVVENSVRLGDWLMEGVRDADVPGLIGRTMTVLGEHP